MPIISANSYLEKRLSYNYISDFKKRLVILPSENIDKNLVGIFSGITSLEKRNRYLSLEEFEVLVWAIFSDATSSSFNNLTQKQISNIRNIANAIVVWANGNLNRTSENNNIYNNKFYWNDKSVHKLLDAYTRFNQRKSGISINDFMFDGISIEIASVFLRFLFPSQYAIITPSIIKGYTNFGNYTNFETTENGKILSTVENINEYDTTYITLLSLEAEWLNSDKIRFLDIDEHTTKPQSWRVADIAIALESPYKTYTKTIN